MNKQPTLPQLKKYDVTQRVINMLADAESRAILFSIVKKGGTAADLSYELNIPLSSVYKKLADLGDMALIRVERLEVSDGRKFRVYRSKISRADISIMHPEPSLTLVPN